MSFQPPLAELYLQQKEYKTNQQTQRISTVRSQIKSEREINNSSGRRCVVAVLGSGNRIVRGAQVE